MVSQLFEGVGLQQTSGLVRRISEDEMVHDFGDPAVVPLREAGSRRSEQGVGAAGELDVAATSFDGRVGIEMRRVSVEPPEIALIDGFGVVRNGAVVVPVEPFLAQGRGHGEFFGNFVHGETKIRQPQGLIVDVAIGVALTREVVGDFFDSPTGPVVRREHHVAVGSVDLERFVDVLAPLQGVTNLCPAQGVEVVHVGGAVFRHAQRAPFGEENVHLGGGLGTGRDLEHHAHTVDGDFGTRGFDVTSGSYQRHARQGGKTFAESGVDVSLFVLGQERTVHVRGTSQHGRTGQNVLADGRFEESGRSNYLYPPRGDVLVRQNSAYAAEVVGVRVGINNCVDGSRTEVLVNHRLGRGGIFLTRQRVNDDPASVPSQKGDIGDVESANLVDPVGDFEKSFDVVETCLTPQARVGGVGCIRGVLEEIVIEIPHRMTKTSDDLAFG